jgi:hypothetical protein
LIYRCILPKWAVAENPRRRRIWEGEFTVEEICKLNAELYNIYFLPNYPSVYEKGVTVEGSHIDTFRLVFVDMDMKDGKYESKEAFIEHVKAADLEPTFIVDSGNGVHVYWQVSDLDAMSFLKLQRRLMRKFNTDEAVGQIYQLMRAPGTVNTKNQDEFKLCEQVYESERVYSCEDLDKFLPPITHDDEEYCRIHYDKIYNTSQEELNIDDKIPLKFAQLLRRSEEVKDIWSGNTEDRSKADYRLGHIMFAAGFSRDEALSVLVNSSKAISRAPVHRLGYASNIVDKIWTYEISENKEELNLSSTVKEILHRSGDTIKGQRFACHTYLDNTEHGFRLGQVIGLVAGSGVGKTAVALNMFEGFVQQNPDFHHFFVPLEQPANEIADRWKTLCGRNVGLHEKVHVISNYNDDGSFRHLSLDDIREYLLKFQKLTGHKVGCVVIDHIGALKKASRDGRQSIEDICHQMKAFAIQTNTLLVMQSQAPREKAGVGDLELNKDAAYGTVFFEAYCDYLITMWQPLKRCYADQGCPTVTAFKFCKIRHKKQQRDVIKEDVCYRLFFDSESEHLREMTQDEEVSFDFFNKKAINKRKSDRKTELISYQSVRWTKEAADGKGTASSNSDSGAA